MRATIFIAVAILLLISGSAPAKPREERWSAMSTTAISITGDILLSPTRLRMEGADFPLKVVADLPRFQGDTGPVAARVLKVTRPMDPKLLNGNKLGCRGPIRWIVVWQFDHGRQLGMDTFKAGPMPTAVKNPTFCGSYFYLRL
jgi:hypothetical protein